MSRSSLSLRRSGNSKSAITTKSPGPPSTLLPKHTSGTGRLSNTRSDPIIDGPESPVPIYTFRPIPCSDLSSLPSLTTAALTDVPQLASQKLQQCTHICDFSDPEIDKANKSTKTAALTELTTCYSNPRTFSKLTRDCHQLVIDVFAANVFRPLPKIPAFLRDSTDVVIEETAWPHLRLVYRLFLQFIDCQIDQRIFQYHLTPHFLMSLFSILDFPDARERTEVKSVITRIFEVVPAHRITLRSMVLNLLMCVSDTILLTAASSLLDLLFVFTNDIPPPLSTQMIFAFEHILLPLHIPSKSTAYFNSLSKCTLMLIRKDAPLGKQLVRFLGAHWPMTLDLKAQLFISEARQLLDDSFDIVEEEICDLLQYIAMAAESPCTRLAESALDFLSDNNFQNLLRKKPVEIMKIIFPAVYRIAQGHWQATTQIKGLDVMKTFMELNPVAFKAVTVSFKSDVVEQCQKRMHKKLQWDAIAEFAGIIDESVGVQTHDDIACFFGTGRYTRVVMSPIGARKKMELPEVVEEMVLSEGNSDDEGNDGDDHVSSALETVHEDE
jgi:serine/threonine-protein phosphatase 2A regulatory subunit B'